jgi:hydrogenase maturation protein HypF
MFAEKIAKQLGIKGIVQGVGFRPFVCQLAKRYGIKGEVANTSSGVSVRIEGISKDIECFCADLIGKAPPLAHISEISACSETVKGFTDFSIIKSKSDADNSTLISPDVSICNDCLRELFDPENRRYLYPFINCTNCGPRYTIISDIPYDRPKTSMRHFKMCEACQAEYDDPENRRFHAQPNACAVCGPRVRLYDNARKEIPCENPVSETATLLRQGYILAIKGLGGFHLAADAENHEAVLRLRKRKHREEKPFALMSYDIAHIRQYAYVEAEEEQLLLSLQRPIVLLRKKQPNPLSEAISPGNKYFGVMLPYTPLHYVLLGSGSGVRGQRLGNSKPLTPYLSPLTSLIMTSGNMSNEPIVIDNEAAFDRLSGIADYFLMHNREIYLRTDDSIVRRVRGSGSEVRGKSPSPRTSNPEPRTPLQFLRRSRGYVPMPVFLKKKVPQILACGADLKNTVCLTKENQAVVSQHIGDMENLATYQFFELTVEHLKRLFRIQPEVIAHDLHPDYMTTRYAKEQKEMQQIPVQHHHAHIVSCMAEHHLDEPVVGLSFDGTGYGTDGNLWGGEILIAEMSRFTRVGHLMYAPMPGGAAAIKEPRRMAIAYLYETFGKDIWNLDLPFLREIGEKKIKILIEMTEKKVNCPLTSSLGRLFDGIAGMTGIRKQVFFEGQAAMELEMLADETTDAVYDYEQISGDMYKIPFQPIVRGVAEDIKQGVHHSEISGKFHRTLIRIFSDLSETICKENGLHCAVLSGGVFQNSILLKGLANSLEAKGIRVFTHSRVPSNDGGISLGQAMVAAALAGKKV